MKASYKILIAMVAVILFARGSLFGTFAQINLFTTSGNFCKRVENLRIDVQVAERITEFQLHHQERMRNLLQRRTQQDITLKNSWQRWLQTRETQLIQVRSLGDTEEQKEAVEVFVSTAKGAIEDLYQAIDGAISDYRINTDDLIAWKQNLVVEAVDAYYYSIKAATDRAGVDCVSGRDEDAVKATFITSTHEAKVQLQNEQRSLVGVNNQINDFVAERDQTIRNATTEFREVVARAREDLLLALKNNNPEDNDISNPEE